MSLTKSWEEFYEVGVQYENIFCQFLDRYNFEPCPAIGYHKEWDIKSKTYQTTFEVKFDGKSKLTSRWAIEVAFQKPSGLSTTKATFWIFTNGDEWFYISTADLRNVCQSIAPSTLTGKGDTKPKTVIFISDAKMRQICKSITRAMRTFISLQ